MKQLAVSAMVVRLRAGHFGSRRTPIPMMITSSMSAMIGKAERGFVMKYIAPNKMGPTDATKSNQRMVIGCANLNLDSFINTSPFLRLCEQCSQQRTMRRGSRQPVAERKSRSRHIRQRK
jgi:hypothetical protein